MLACLSKWGMQYVKPQYKVRYRRGFVPSPGPSRGEHLSTEGCVDLGSPGVPSFRERPAEKNRL